MKGCRWCPDRHARPDDLRTVHTCTNPTHRIADGPDGTHLHDMGGAWLLYRYTPTPQEQAGRDVFGAQTCEHCRGEHPGRTCGLQDLAVPLF